MTHHYVSFLPSDLFFLYKEAVPLTPSLPYIPQSTVSISACIHRVEETRASQKPDAASANRAKRVLQQRQRLSTYYSVTTPEELTPRETQASDMLGDRCCCRLQGCLARLILESISPYDRDETEVAA